MPVTHSRTSMCERLDLSFSEWAPTERAADPACTTLRAAARVGTLTRVRPTTSTTPAAVSRTGRPEEEEEE